MSNPIKAEGLVLAYDEGTHVYPVACAQNSTFTITQDFIELAPKTSGNWREFKGARKTFVISGDGLLKLDDTYGVADDYFENKILTGSNQVIGYLFIADEANGKLYKFSGIMTEYSYNSSVGNFAKYNYAIQGNGQPEALYEDENVVAAGVVEGVDPVNYRFVGLAIDGKIYFNFTPDPVTGDITVGSQFNGKTAVIFYDDI